MRSTWNKGGVDALQAEDYFALVAEFSKPGGRTAEIREAIREALPPQLGRVNPADLRLVQVDYLFMPGKEQVARMSAREVAEKKQDAIKEVGKNTQVVFNLHYYERGSIQTLKKNN